MEWNKSETWLLTADHSGNIKYWQSNMNNVKAFDAHTEVIRDARLVQVKMIDHCNIKTTALPKPIIDSLKYMLWWPIIFASIMFEIHNHIINYIQNNRCYFSFYIACGKKDEIAVFTL